MFEGIHGTIFDLDGTLLDSMGVWGKIDRIFLQKRGIRLPDDYSQAIKSMKYREAAAYTRSRFGLKETEEEIAAEWQAMAEQEYAAHIRLKPGAKALLKRLRQMRFKLALATGSGRRLYESALRNNAVYGLFDAFVTLDEVKTPKSSPDIYLLAAERLGLLPQECLVFEDVLQAVLGAKAAGMRVIGVYDAASAQERASIEAAADGYITDFRQFLPIIPGRALRPKHERTSE